MNDKYSFIGTITDVTTKGIVLTYDEVQWNLYNIEEFKERLKTFYVNYTDKDIRGTIDLLRNFDGMFIGIGYNYWPPDQYTTQMLLTYDEIQWNIYNIEEFKERLRNYHNDNEQRVNEDIVWLRDFKETMVGIIPYE